MMKKEYFAPDMEIVEIGLSGMLCTSGGNVFDEDTEVVSDDGGEAGAIAE